MQFFNSIGVVWDSIKSFLRFWHFYYKFLIKRFLIKKSVYVLNLQSPRLCPEKLAGGKCQKVFGMTANVYPYCIHVNERLSQPYLRGHILYVYVYPSPPPHPQMARG